MTDDFSASFAHLRRKALHLPTQSFACAPAKLCIRLRKALHVLSQSFACAYAKHCMRQRKALHPLPQTFAYLIIYISRLNQWSLTVGSACKWYLHPYMLRCVYFHPAYFLAVFFLAVAAVFGLAAVFASGFVSVSAFVAAGFSIPLSSTVKMSVEYGLI